MTLDGLANINQLALVADGASKYANYRATNANSTAALSMGVGGSAVGAGALQNNAYVWNTGNSALSFGTNDTERARINSSGDFLVGTTSAISSSKVAVSAGLNTYNMLVLKNTDVQSAGQLFELFLNSAGNTAGSIGHTGTTTVAFNTTSDYRLKHDIEPMTTGLNTVLSLQPVKYKWNEDNSVGEGFIAHELQEIIPLAVSGNKDAVNEDGSIRPQGVDYSKIVVHLVSAIQEQQALITALTARIEALEKK